MPREADQTVIADNPAPAAPSPIRVAKPVTVEEEFDAGCLMVIRMEEGKAPRLINATPAEMNTGSDPGLVMLNVMEVDRHAPGGGAVREGAMAIVETMGPPGRLADGGADLRRPGARPLGLKVSRAEGEADPDPRDRAAGHGLRDPRDPGGHEAPGVIGAVGAAGLAIPRARRSTPSSRPIQPQLNRLLPHHGFKLLDAQSAQIVAGESVECKLGHGYTAETTLVRPIDENGKVQLRCELSLDRELQFSATVRTPINQLFFCERPSSPTARSC